MTDRALANAEKRRDELAAQINQTNQRLADLRKDLAATETFIADWHRYADTGTDRATHTQMDSGYPQTVHAAGVALTGVAGLGLAAGVAPFPGGGVVAGIGVAGGAVASSRKNPERSVVGKHAREIITVTKRPVPRNELFTLLGLRGINIVGKDPEMVLSTMMWRMKDDFVRLAGHGYWLKELPWQPAKYEPGIEPQRDDEDLELALNAFQNADVDGD
jgi:hypothetical protein